MGSTAGRGRGGTTRSGQAADPASRVVPRSVWVAAAATGLDGVVVVAFGVFFGVELVVARATNPTAAVFGTGLLLVTGTALLVVARGLMRLRTWARTPASMTHLLALPVAYGLLEGHRVDLGIPLLVGSLVGLVAVFAPSTTQAIFADQQG
ncbi:MAG: hypothetical protein ACYCXA_04050 [Actinomycetes bacterium]